MLALLPNSRLLHGRKSLIENILFLALVIPSSFDSLSQQSHTNGSQLLLEYISCQTHTYLFGRFFYIYTICVVMEVCHLSGLVPTYRFAFDFDTRTCIVIHHLLILRASASLPKFSCFQKGCKYCRSVPLMLYNISPLQITFCFQVATFFNFVL